MTACGGSDRDDEDEKDGRIVCAKCDGTGKCNYCHGSGICSFCHGQKSYYDDTDGIAYANECGSCGDSGSCFFCGGRGICSDCDGTGYLTNSNGNDWSDYDDDYDYGGSGGGGSSEKTCKYCLGYKDCRNYFYTSNDKYYCHGSGKCKWCGGDGWQDGLFGTGPNSITCSACNTPGHDNVGGDGYCGYCGGTGVCGHCGGTGIEP